jgi:hypothetical protein
MNYAAEIGSGAIICITSFTQIGSAIQKLLRGIRIHRQQGDRIHLLLFFKIRKAGFSAPAGLFQGKEPSVTIT